MCKVHYPISKEINDLSDEIKNRLLSEIKINEDILNTEMEEYCKNVVTLFQNFKNHGLNDDISAAFTMGFYNDSVISEKRKNLESVSDIIEKYKYIANKEKSSRLNYQYATPTELLSIGKSSKNITQNEV